MTETNRNKSAFLLIGLGVLIVIGAAIYHLSSKTAPPPRPQSDTPSAPIAAADTDTQESASPAAKIADAVAGAAEAITSVGSFKLDVDAFLQDRILGDPKADIKISEHSSLTCGHCGNFHKNVFKSFKEAYLDSGKAYLVYSDFPLNAPALHASMAARCVPKDRFFDFVQALFETQDDWAYGTEYLAQLKIKSGEFGLKGDDFETCIQSDALRDGLLAKMRAAQQQWSINSTPSFVVNNQVTISGASDFEAFDQSIQDALNPQPAGDAKAE